MYFTGRPKAGRQLIRSLGNKIESKLDAGRM